MVSWSRMRRVGAVTAVVTIALGVGVAQAGPTVNASNYSFKPKTITIQKGQTVTWKWVNGSHPARLADHRGPLPHPIAPGTE